jgi:hypothetical protein
MMQTTLPINKRVLSDLLAGIADELDISEKLYEEATIKYEEVGLWLAQDENGLAKYSPEIYAQGSFRLGTVVHPIDPSCDYDIDLVCHLDIKKDSTTQKDLKAIVGKRLQEHPDLAPILTSSRRCWNLSYPKQFHMDVLPAIPNAEQLPGGILLTDTELTRWQKSDPKSYAEWFYEQMTVRFNEQRAIIAKALQANIEDVPTWRVKTPLQRAVQLLKRHRDVTFRGDTEHRPVSIIITTLAARAYDNQANIYDALLGIVDRMPHYIENRNGRWWVENPVEPDENFADKWNEKPARRLAFLNWLDRVRDETQATLQSRDLREAVTKMSPRFGTTTVASAEATVQKAFDVTAPSPTIAPRPLPTIEAYVPHCRPPQWQTSIRYKVDVTGALYTKQHGQRVAELARRRIPKKMWLRFGIRTNTPLPYTVSWQVVNTGAEAAAATQLRGDFYDAEYENGVRWESTNYSGLHWVEAFIVKDGTCVARSGRKYVNVA